jgi:hypothetical protein
MTTTELSLDVMPATCASRSLMDDSPILIKLGETGYYPQNIHFDVEGYNATLGITEAHKMAMEGGSMFGWHCPGSKASECAKIIARKGRRKR